MSLAVHELPDPTHLDGGKRKERYSEPVYQRIRGAEEFYLSFYRDGDLFNHGLPGSGGENNLHFMFEGSQTVPDFLKQLDTQAVLSEYWEKHNSAYIARIEKIARRQPAVNLEDARAVLVVAAMNETEIRRAIVAVRGNHDPVKYPVIVYHNFKTEPDQDILDAIRDTTQIPSVYVFEEQVPPDNMVAAAKKVSSDIAQFLIPPEKDIPLILFDADVTAVSPKLTAKTAKILPEYTTLTVSPTYVFDTEVSRAYPVMGLLNEIRREMEIFCYRHRYGAKNTIGSFIGIMRKTLAALGGIKPAVKEEDYRLVTFEDKQLSEDLSTLMYHSHDAASSPHIFTDALPGHYVCVDPSRELADLIRGRRPDYRWLESNNYAEVSGTRRPQIDLLGNYEGIPLLGKMTAENLTAAVNTFWTEYAEKTGFIFYGNVLSLKMMDIFSSKSYKPYVTIVYNGKLLGNGYEFQFEAAMKILANKKYGSMMIKSFHFKQEDLQSGSSA